MASKKKGWKAPYLGCTGHVVDAQQFETNEKSTEETFLYLKLQNLTKPKDNSINLPLQKRFRPPSQAQPPPAPGAGERGLSAPVLGAQAGRWGGLPVSGRGLSGRHWASSQGAGPQVQAAGLPAASGRGPLGGRQDAQGPGARGPEETRSGPPGSGGDRLPGGCAVPKPVSGPAWGILN